MPESTTEDDKWRNFLDISKMYFELCINICQEMQGPQGTNFQGSWESEEKKINWGDAKMAVPLLFNFYHALEIFMKGAILKEKNELIKSHEFKTLFGEFEKIDNSEKEIINILNRYINPQKGLILEWMNKNNLSNSDLYQFFRYPTDKGRLRKIKYLNLMYKDKKERKSFYGEMERDVDILIKKINAYLTASRKKKSK